MASIPERISKYEVLRRLGHGGMGTVYLARDPDLGRQLAIKVLREQVFEEEVLQRFLQEARSAGNLRHENIITVYDAGTHDHQPFMAMEYVDGVSLADMIRSRQPLALSDKLSYLEQICAGLHFAHAHGIVHRDIKPANLMVDRRNIVRILDFGIARVEGSGMTRDGAMMGTLNYMSPEQMLGRPVDHRSDVFAFGTVAYELLAYQRAFPGSIDDGLLHRLPHEPPKPLNDLCPGLPEEVEPLVMRALAKLPQDRFADLDEARLALRQIRRHVDPNLDLEPIQTPRRGQVGPVTTPAPAVTAERRDLLERRARQLAYHRDAARAALVAHDVDGAASAVEDALTIDPDDTEALQLLTEVNKAREQQGAESKERRERERMVRRLLADADLKQAKGDTDEAIDLLKQVVALDPDNARALDILRQVEPSSLPPGTAPQPTAVPQATVLVPRAGRATDAAPSAPAAPATSTGAHETAAPPSALPMRTIAVVGAGVAAAVVAGVLWFGSRGDNVDPSQPVTTSAEAPPPSAAPAPSPAAVPPAAAPMETPVTPPPAVTTPASLDAQLAQITKVYRSGDHAGALAGLGPVLAQTNDERAQTLARTIAVDARRLMTTAATAARTQRASEHSPALFATAEQTRALSDQAFGRNRFVDAGTQAIRATASYVNAEREAISIAAKSVTTRPREEATAPATPTPIPQPQPPAATPNVAVNNPPPVVTPAPTPTPSPVVPAPPPAAAPAAAAAAAPPSAASALASEQPGLLRTLGRYQQAYRDRSIKALRDVYPKLNREAGQKIERTFRDCRAYEYSYLNPRFSIAGDDPTSITMNTQSTYTCQPRGAQEAQTVSGPEVFLFRKLGDEWFIEDAFMGGATRR